MKLKPICAGMILALSAVFVNAGGNPEFVKFPEGYADSFTNYVVMNRAGMELVAKMYANDVAVSSYKAGKTAPPGSVVVMEVYKPKKDAEGEAVKGEDGIYEADKLAAVAVMERRDSWDAAYPMDNRAGNWGFAIYNPDGTPKKNDLDCVQCHTPLKAQDYLYTHQPLVEHATR